MADDWDWDDPDDPDDPGDPDVVEPASGPVAKSLLTGFAIGVASTVVMVAIGFSLIAVPLFAFARADAGRGLDNPIVRTGLLYVALPVGLVVGVASGTLVSVWLMRGGKMPTDRLPFYEVE